MGAVVQSHRPETRLREQIAAVGRSIFERGLTAGSSGSISVRLDDGCYWSACATSIPVHAWW